jgi:hypothetical protein
MKLVANLKDKMTENKECQWGTMTISNTGESGNNKTNWP